ncbi:MAG TPA: hypothetical protein ENN28_00325 [Candidatus Uhrbacteria bacterium]|nr:hypothetical protein [Candidatus Uhrbacteria bacterium]
MGKKIFLFIILAVFILLAIVNPVSAQYKAPLTVYFFWGEGCPHCIKEKDFLEKIKSTYPQVIIKDFEVYKNAENSRLLQQISRETDIDVRGVPLVIIGDQAIVGFLNEQTTGQQIQSLINDCLKKQCPDLVVSIIKPKEEKPPITPLPDPKEPNETYIINLPVIGEIDAKAFSLPLLTIIIAAIDGFNPCAMWVLIFLISLLLGMKDKKRMWILGITFLAASGFVYFLFLSAWLNFFLFIGFIFWVRILIGSVAIGSGVYQLKEFYKNRPGCKVVKGELRDKIFTNLKFITKIPSFWLALIGIIFVAFAVNLIELVCSAGLPAIYTNILSMSDMALWKYYLLLLLYIAIFMLDDFFVFAVAMLTLQITGVHAKYVRHSNLIGGIIILILGILLILKPELLMFS